MTDRTPATDPHLTVITNSKGQAVPRAVTPVGADAFAPQEQTSVTWLGGAGAAHQRARHPHHDRPRTRRIRYARRL